MQKGYYPTSSIFLSLAILALLRIKTLSGVDSLPSGELGRMIGLDRIPEVKTLRTRIVKFSEITNITEWELNLSKYWMEETPELSAVLYIEADRTIYFPHKIQRPFDLRKKFLVVYFGTILPLQGVEVVLEAIQLLKENKDIHFLFIGPLKGKLKEQYISLPNTLFICWIVQEKLSNYIAMSDLCLAGHFHPDIEKAKRVIPGKAMIYQAMNKAMILGENQANRERFTEGNGVYYVKMGSAQLLAELINKISRQRSI